MKLFLWADPYPVPYGSSMVFAVADSEEQARRMIQSENPAWAYGEYDQTPIAWNEELGPPTRVVEVPCVEWHEWEE